MVDGVDAQQRRVADPVGHPRVQELGPEGLVTRGIGSAQADVAEMRDPGVARRKIALAAVIRPHDQLDPVSARVLEGEDLLDAALLAFVFCPVVHRVPCFLDLGTGLVEVFAIFQIEADSMVRGIAFEIDERVVARVAARRGLVAAEVGGLAFPAREFQADDAGRELDGRIEIGRADPQIADVVEIDHPRYFISGMPKLAPGFTPSRQREVTVLMRV